MKTLKKKISRLRRHHRIRSKIKGTPRRPRLVIYRSLSHHYAQLVDDTTHHTVASASDLKSAVKVAKSERARKVGLEIAKLAQAKNITTCVFDRNGYKYHGRVKAIAESARAGRLKF